MSNFRTVREDNLYYVDKTMYLPKLEKEARNLFFIRPRRFGKSVFISMLHAYYDIRTKDQFQNWFGDLWIGKHPTPLQGKFRMLYLDFSQVGGNIEKLEDKFNFYLGVELDGFVRNYKEYYRQWQDAEAQIKRYAEAPRVEALRQGTQLHKIIIQFDGWNLYKIDEVK